MILLLLLLVFLCPAAWADDPWRLPGDVVPKAYRITIAPDVPAKKFSGDETVDVEVRRATARVVLNALELEIPSATIDGKPAQVTLDAKRERVALQAAEALQPGPHQVALQFKGRLHTAAQGMYLVPNGNETILTTQMEPADCRRMFPCWDEPSYQSTFQLTAIVPQAWLAVSNMPGTETTQADGTKRVVFAASPPMASYLVALVAGHLDTISDTAGSLPIRLVAAPGQAKRGAYALHTLQQILPFYGEFFGVAYPLPKLDLIALPNSHNGAMENWGCITFDETEVLFDPQQSSHDTEERVYNTVSHEVAHQWFGDLVTMAWWDDLWLNESFANFMADTVTDHFNPQWKVWLGSFQDREHSMALDALSATHPIHQTIHSPAEADSAFDEITYDKGEAVMRMIADWLGADTFRDGLRRYMKAHAYGNSVEGDLWQSLGGARVATLAGTWVNQPGFPEVRVQGASADQHRFNDPSSPERWQIPIDGTVLATRRGTLATRDGKLNRNGIGYYRVLYTRDRLHRLAHSAMLLSPADRVNLLGDTWAQTRLGEVPLADMLSLIEAVRTDRELAIWEQILGDLATLDDYERDRPEHNSWQAWCRHLLQPVMHDLGWDPTPGEPDNRSLLRARIIGALGRYDDYAVVTEARHRFAIGPLTGDLRDAVVSVVGRHADAATWNALRDRGRHSQDLEDQTVYYDALGLAADPTLAERTLKLSLTSEPSPVMAPLLVIQVAAQHPDMAYRFALSHRPALLASLTVDERQNYLPNLMMAGFSDVKHAQLLQAETEPSVPVRKAVAKLQAAAAEKARLVPQLRTALAGAYRSAPRR